MSEATINFIHLCDAATIDSSGKLNILGIFKIIYLSSIPGRFPKFTAVVNVSLEESSTKENKLEVRITDKENDDIKIDPPIEVNFNIPNEENKKPELSLILDINNLEFKNTGEYTLKLFLNGLEIGGKKFNVEKSEVK